MIAMSQIAYRLGFGRACARFVGEFLAPAKDAAKRRCIDRFFWSRGVFGGLGYTVITNASVLLPAVGKDATLSERTIIWGPPPGLRLPSIRC